MGIFMFRLSDVKMTLYIVIILKILQVFCFFNAKNDVRHCKEKVPMATSDWKGY